jgi:hypothetical protein
MICTTLALVCQPVSRCLFWLDRAVSSNALPLCECTLLVRSRSVAADCLKLPSWYCADQLNP